MDDAALQDRLAAIERRQYAILTLLAGLYAYGVAELAGYWVVGVVGVVVFVVAFAGLVFSSRAEGADSLGE